MPSPTAASSYPSFRRLKVWLSLKAHGLRQFVSIIEQNVEHARRLGELVARHPDLELLTPVSLNIVCFRYAPKGRQKIELNEPTRRSCSASRSRELPSVGTVLNGRYAIRVAITNHRSRWEDFETLLSRGDKTGVRSLSLRTRDSRRGGNLIWKVNRWWTSCRTF
jgi:glutamate/tyrosine decarboxylase-like PLP-dependent enzyme